MPNEILGEDVPAAEAGPQPNLNEEALRELHRILTESRPATREELAALDPGTALQDSPLSQEEVVEEANVRNEIEQAIRNMNLRDIIVNTQPMSEIQSGSTAWYDVEPGPVWPAGQAVRISSQTGAIELCDAADPLRIGTVAYESYGPRVAVTLTPVNSDVLVWNNNSDAFPMQLVSTEIHTAPVFEHKFVPLKNREIKTEVKSTPVDCVEMSKPCSFCNEHICKCVIQFKPYSRPAVEHYQILGAQTGRYRPAEPGVMEVRDGDEPPFIGYNREHYPVGERPLTPAEQMRDILNANRELNVDVMLPVIPAENIQLEFTVTPEGVLMPTPPDPLQNN